MGLIETPAEVSRYPQLPKGICYKSREVFQMDNRLYKPRYYIKQNHNWMCNNCIDAIKCELQNA